MAYLAGLGKGMRVDFNFLLNHLSLTDGNLSIHLKKLESAGFVQLTKKFVDKKPKTWIEITSSGKKDFKEYLKNLNKVLGK